MALSDSNQSYKIYVSTQPIPNTSYNYKETPLIKFKVDVKVKFVISDELAAGKSIPIDHVSSHEIEHNLIDDQLTRDFLSNMFANTRIIPFSLGNLYGKKQPNDNEWILLASTDAVVTLMLDICYGMVNNSERNKKLLLLVFITKEVTLSYDEYQATIKAEEAQAQKTLQLAQDLIRFQTQQGWNFGPSQWDMMENEMRKAGLGNSVIRDALNTARERAIRESAERARTLVPAAERYIQALKKVIYNGSQEKCHVCMEDLLLGSQVTRIPCSHLFHGDCLVSWLRTSHVCPVCRFGLPTE